MGHKRKEAKIVHDGYDATAEVERREGEVEDALRAQNVEGLHEVVANDPYLGLPDGQRRVLMVSSLPDTAHLSITERSRLAGVSRQTWYETINRPDYPERLRGVTHRIMDRAVLDVWHTYLNLALHGGKHGMGDRQALERILEEVGVFTPSSGIGLTVHRAQGAGDSTRIEVMRRENLRHGLSMFGVEIVDMPIQESTQSMLPDRGSVEPEYEVLDTRAEDSANVGMIDPVSEDTRGVNVDSTVEDTQGGEPVNVDGDGDDYPVE